MATPTYDLLDSVTLASSASSVTFSSIDQSYGDLVLVITATTDVAGKLVGLKLNADTGDVYPRVYMIGNGSSATSASNAFGDVYQLAQGVGTSTTTPVISQTQIMDYSATNKHKSMLTRFNQADAATVASAARWANTSAVTTIQVVLSSGNYASGSTFSVYGVAK